MNITNPAVEQYIDSMIPRRSDVSTRLEQEAREEGIPNIVISSMQLIKMLLKWKPPASILEIGTAIGYSAIQMAEAAPDAVITTLEMNPERAERAVRNFAEAGLQHRIRCIVGDALHTLPTLDHTYDIIFIDAAKGQYSRFLELSLNKLRPEGMIISDNVLFRGMAAQASDEISDKHRSMVRKLKDYNSGLMDHPLLETAIVPIGDGIAVSSRRHDNKEGASHE